MNPPPALVPRTDSDSNDLIDLDLAVAGVSTTSPRNETLDTFNTFDIPTQSHHYTPLPISKPIMTKPGVPKPGPAKLSKNAGLEEWLEQAKQCKHLPESVMKQLCEIVKECLMEG